MFCTKYREICHRHGWTTTDNGSTVFVCKETEKGDTYSFHANRENFLDEVGAASDLLSSDVQSYAEGVYQGKPNFLDDGCMQELKSDGMNGNNNKSFSLKGAFPMKSFKRVASAVLGMAMVASCMAPITAFAAEDFQQPADNSSIANHPNDETMLHSTPVYRIGTKSFYKVNDDGSVTYADQDTAGFKAIPAAYIMGSSYNTVGEYGIYTTTKSDGSKLEHFVKIADCQEANGKVKSYTYWYSNPATQPGWTEPANYHQMGADEHINASGECYVIFIDGKWDFKAAGTLTGDELRETVKSIDANHQLAEDFVISDGETSCNFGKKFDVGTSMTDNSKREGLALKVSELQAEPATWRVVPMSTSALKRGEIAMSIAPASAMYNGKE